MPWIKLDVNFLEHPKVDSLSDGAKLLHLWGLCYSGRQLTDGFIPEKQVSTIERLPLVAELVTALLWHHVTGGYEIHDYLEHQSSREQVKVTQETTRKRVEKHREKTRVTALQPALVTPLELEVEIEVEVNTIDEKFKEFLSVFPRKDGGKITIKKALEKALRVTTFEEIMAGARKYANDPNRAPDYTKMPATWLNKGCWDDPLLPKPTQVGLKRVDNTPTVVPPPFDPKEFAKVPLNVEKLAEIRREYNV